MTETRTVASTPLLSLPAGWSWLLPNPPRPGGATVLDRHVAATLEAAGATAAPLLAGAGIVAAAIFALPSPAEGQVVEASLLVAYARIPAVDDPLRVLATATPHRCERAVSPFSSRLGPGMRGLWVRDATELADKAGSRPLSLTVRYVLPFTPRVALLLQFRTVSVLYAGELIDLFDAIAATATAEASQS